MNLGDEPSILPLGLPTIRAVFRAPLQHRSIVGNALSQRGHRRVDNFRIE